MLADLTLRLHSWVLISLSSLSSLSRSNDKFHNLYYRPDNRRDCLPQTTIEYPHRRGAIVNGGRWARWCDRETPTRQSIRHVRSGEEKTNGNDGNFFKNTFFFFFFVGPRAAVAPTPAPTAVTLVVLVYRRTGFRIGRYRRRSKGTLGGRKFNGDRTTRA